MLDWEGYEDGVGRNRAGKLVMAGALCTGATVFVASFVVINFVWTHFVVTDVNQLGIGDGVLVGGGGFIAGTTLGLAALVRGANTPGQASV